MHRGDDSKRTAGEDMIVGWFQETLSTMQLRDVWSMSVPALPKGKRIGLMECRVKRLSKLLVMCQTSALLCWKGGMFEGRQGSGTPLSTGGASSAISQIRYYHWGSSSLSGEIPRAAIQGILLPSPVEALVPLWISLEAAVAQALRAPGWVPMYCRYRGTSLKWPPRRVPAGSVTVSGSSDLGPQTTD